MEKRRNLPDPPNPGLWKYLRIAEGYAKYAKNISISSLKQTFYTVRAKCAIKRLIMIRIVVFGQRYGSFWTHTFADMCYNQWSGRGRKTIFSMSGYILICLFCQALLSCRMCETEFCPAKISISQAYDGREIIDFLETGDRLSRKPVKMSTSRKNVHSLA